MKIMSVVGARPNFIKIAAFINEIDKRTTEGGVAKSDVATKSEVVKHCLVHTGQHYDDKMSKAFFDVLNIPKPDIDLGVGSGSHAEQVGRTMIEFEKVVRDWRPDWIVVVGDVNATCACSIVAKKEHIKLAHIEAGLRSFDLDMPEEINRMVTDRLADLLFTTSEFANDNLRKEGVPENKIKFVGNIMIDTLEASRAKAEALDLNSIIEQNLVPEQTFHVSRLPLRSSSFATGRPPCGRLTIHEFALQTLHRPSNVDEREILEPLVRFFIDVVSKEMPLIWTLHPRTRKMLEEFGLMDDVAGCEDIVLLEPIGYLEMLKLNMDASLIFTDSGGLQEECSVLGTPCITLRANTERPITLSDNGGVSVLTGNDVSRIRKAFNEMKDEPSKEHRPPLWDGKASHRIVEAILLSKAENGKLKVEIRERQSRERKAEGEED